MWNKIFGWVATLSAGFVRIPQIYKLHKTKKGEDISTKSYIIWNIHVIFLFMYAYLQKDTILMVMSGSGFLQNCIIIGLKKYYQINNELIN